MKKYVFSIFALFSAIGLFGQVDPINYEFEILEFRQHSCEDGVPGDDNESTWKLWVRDDQMGGIWQLGDCHFGDDALDNIYQPTTNSSIFQTNTLAELLDIRIDFWEDDCDGGTGSDRCSYGSCYFGTVSDDDRENHNPYIGNGGTHPSIVIRDYEYCQWHILEYSVGCFSFRVRFKWEYVGISAGPQTIVGCDDSLQLNGFGSGEWSITNGNGGGFIDSRDPNTVFFGNAGEQYELTFSILNTCRNFQSINGSDIQVTMAESINPQLAIAGSTCEGATQEFDVADGGTYYWADGSLTNYIDTTVLNEFSYAPSGSNVDVYVTVESPDGCLSYDSLNYTLTQSPQVDLGNDTIICPGTYVSIDGTNQNMGLTQYLWSNGVQNSVADLSLPGQYIINLTDLNSCTNSDTIIIDNYPVSPLDLGPDVTFCMGDAVVLDAGDQHTFNSYLWSDGSTEDTLEVTAFGDYYVDAIDANNCTFTDTVNFSPVYTYFSLYNDTMIYLGTWLDLEAPSGVSYDWNTGEVTQSITVTPEQDEVYSVTIEQTDGCFMVGTVNVFIDNSVVVFIPNMFSPNNDGSNDELLIYGNAIETVDFKIFNRWGDLIFQSDDPMIGWDGTANGEAQPAGTYIWTLQGTDSYGNEIKVNEKNTGSVLLRR